METEQFWKDNLRTRDYHDKTKGDNFFKWVKEKLISLLSLTSVVLIIGNASYHTPSRQLPRASFEKVENRPD